eukprot:CAMPEP_0184379116 /NCGR_PEP_ID=MMETSP0007-20130409/3566_1 /TAXON_ID=97485 /ORGANISM="Prymnesium parvum, Strain Texoma1" /LENGTH=138 /DNA_ID=CAMNT_0026723615 /DNA_START=309 /DNA_END=725 /DNA_ORIENTATION=+
MPLDPRLSHHADMRHVPKDLIVVEAIANHELIGNTEAHVVGDESFALRRALGEQRGDFDGLGAEGLEVRDQAEHRAAGVDDVLAEQQVPPFHLAEVDAEALDLHVPRRLRAGVRLDADEVERERRRRAAAQREVLQRL